MEKVRAHLLINGDVQGVYFRANTRNKAQSLGISGWVRNLPDGKVEAVFEGPKVMVEEVVKWCHEGPPGARVTGVDVRWLEYKGEFMSFDIRYSL
ncbi:MAG TPA: acylphosphatase [Nitrospiraceae bacterium]|nr:acylphosphatase [Nitrospiraceae bacterium]